MLDKKKTGMALGVVLAVWHLGWSIMIWLGIAQWAMDWALRLHGLNNPFVVGSFGVARFVGLMIMTFVAGYVLGWIFAYVWNKVSKNSQ